MDAKFQKPQQEKATFAGYPGQKMATDEALQKLVESRTTAPVAETPPVSEPKAKRSRKALTLWKAGEAIERVCSKLSDADASSVLAALTQRYSERRSSVALSGGGAIPADAARQLAIPGA